MEWRQRPLRDDAVVLVVDAVYFRGVADCVKSAKPVLFALAVYPDGSEEVVGFRVVYSREQQPRGLCHHISMSSSRKGRYVTPEAFQIICELFGIQQRLQDALLLDHEMPRSDAETGVPVSAVFLVKKEEDATNVRSFASGETAGSQ